jgi:FMN phosphatase YigB (HAD superfamily)
MRNGTPANRKKIVFLFDVDNTLLNNDRVTKDLEDYLQLQVGTAGAKRYWAMFEELRDQVGYADYLGALQGVRIKYPHDLRILTVSQFLINYSFANRLFPNALDVIEKARSWGRVALLSDGDVVFQPRKIERSGLCEAVDGNVLIYVHKEVELEDVARRFPANHYVMVDDKIRLLTAIKKTWKNRVTTVFVRQGHYALDKKIVASCPPADITLERIGDFLGHELSDFLGTSREKSKSPK